MAKARLSLAPGLALAASFLTAIPVRTAAPQPGDLSRAAVWFPLIGLGLGALLALAHWLLGALFAPLLAAVLLVGLWAGLTGGLHLDGLADCGDGLLSPAAPERRLEIMRDPRLGAFGVTALVLFLAAKAAAVASLPASWSWPALAPLLLAPAAARWLLLVVARQPAARLGGMGQGFAAGLTPAIVVLAAIVPGALALLAGPRAWVAVLVAAAVTVFVVRLARARLGGVTGDVFGLTVELSELAVLLTYAARPVAG